MIYRTFWAAVFCLGITGSLWAQASQEARFAILREVIAQQCSAVIGMPFGAGGFDLSDSGEINQKQVEERIRKDGQSIDPGRIVTITAIDFGNDKIEIELDGGGKNERRWWERIQVGMGGAGVPVGGSDEDLQKAKGSKIVLNFTGRVPADLTPDMLREYLNPVLDFNKQNFMKTGIEALPPEFQEAVRAKEPRVGMDKETVRMAMDRPNRTSREAVNGIMQETWIYYGRGTRHTFVVFEDNIVISVKEFTMAP